MKKKEVKMEYEEITRLVTEYKCLNCGAIHGAKIHAQNCCSSEYTCLFCNKKWKTEDEAWFCCFALEELEKNKRRFKILSLKILESDQDCESIRVACQLNFPNGFFTTFNADTYDGYTIELDTESIKSERPYNTDSLKSARNAITDEQKDRLYEFITGEFEPRYMYEQTIAGCIDDKTIVTIGGDRYKYVGAVV